MRAREGFDLGRTRRTNRVWALRWSSRAPRLAVIAACMVLSAVGLRSLAKGPVRSLATPPKAMEADVTAAAFAEDFARTYLVWDARWPERHERMLRRFLGSDVDSGAGFVLPPSGSQRVLWTAVVAQRAMDPRRRVVTVAAQTDRGRVHLAVSVSRDTRGLLFVSTPPAIVGPPPSTTNATSEPESEVEDRALRTVAARVVRNFLAREREDLAADLDARAIVSLPDRRLQVRSTDAITWVAEPRRVAVGVTAGAKSEPRMSLRYELTVLRVGGRWLVRTVHTNPIAQEGDR